MPFYKTYVSSCSHCKLQLQDSHIDKQLLESAKRHYDDLGFIQKYKPSLYFVVFILICIGFAKGTEQLNLSYIKNPHVGDMYVLQRHDTTDPKNDSYNYTLMVVRGINDDSSVRMHNFGNNVYSCFAQNGGTAPTSCGSLEQYKILEFFNNNNIKESGIDFRFTVKDLTEDYKNGINLPTVFFDSDSTSTEVTQFKITDVVRQ